MDERIYSQELQRYGFDVSLDVPAKYRRVVFDEQVEAVLKEICLGIAERYQVKFLEIGTDKDHVHFLVQSVPSYSVTSL